MKTLLLTVALGLIFSLTHVTAQDEGSKFGNDSVKCVENASLYDGFLKQQNYVDAVGPWRWMFFNCPRSYKRLYLDGITIMKKLMKAETDAAKQDKYVDTIMMIYDQRIKYFGQEGYVLGRKGVDYFDLRRKTDVETAYKILFRSVELEKGKTEPAVLVKFMQATVLMHKKQAIDDAAFVFNYMNTSDAMHEQLKETPNDSTLLKGNDMILSILVSSDLAQSCEKLEKIFSNIFETNKSVAVLRSIVSVLSAKDCVESELFYNVLVELDKLEPSEISKKNLGRQSEKKDKYSDAVNYYKEAVELSGSDIAKGSYYFEIAKITGTKLGNSASSRNYAYQARDLNNELSPNVYILISTLYGNAASACSANDYEKCMVYILAYEMALKAKSYKMSDGLSQTANDLIATYKNNFPKTEDIFFNGDKVGGSKTIGCWINETITIKARE